MSKTQIKITDHPKGEVIPAEFARRLGCNRSYISRLMKEGKIPYSGEGRNKKIDWVVGCTAYLDLTDPNRDEQRKWGEKQRLIAELEKAVGGGIDKDKIKNLKIGNIGCSDSDINRETRKSRLYRETYQALIAEVEYNEKIGKLIPVENLTEVNRQIAGTVRTHIIGVRKLAKQLTKKNKNEIEGILIDWGNKALEEMYTMRGVTKDD